MRLVEILHEEQLEEGLDLDFVQLYKTYGSWLHPRKPEPVYVNDRHGHDAAARQIIGNLPNEQSTYGAMFNDGWVRAVHNGMDSLSLSGTAEALRAIFPKIAAFKDAVNSIHLDVEDCSGGRCFTVNSGHFNMPYEWSGLRRAIS